MDAATQDTKYVYESPDGGKTIYLRSFLGTTRQLLKASTVPSNKKQSYDTAYKFEVCLTFYDSDIIEDD